MTRQEASQALTELVCLSQAVGALGQRMRRLRNPNTKRAKQLDAAYLKATGEQADLAASIRWILTTGEVD